ncbi:MAG: hypothetical protein RQ743_00910 [Bacteroidales bacterium]|nr:hypothetical protein [Bacteroidales bacterium]
MKNRIIYLIVAMIMAGACQNTDNKKEAAEDKRESGDKEEVKKYYSEGRLVKEVTFRNDVRNGICRNYYDDGRLKRTIWYENGLKEDTARWYYPEGKVYRATPYKNDKIHGVQIKYYKTGRVQATIPYKNGLRTQGLKEYLPDGRDAESYPTINHTIRDQIDTETGVLKVFTQLSNESVNVRFYRGSLIEGAFDPEKCKDITTSSGMGYTELRPDSEKGKGYVDIIALYSTRFRNRKIITQRIKLPYNNLY